MVKSAGDSSLRFGMTIYYFTGVGERSGDSLRNIVKGQNRVCESPLLSPYTTISPCHSEASARNLLIQEGKWHREGLHVKLFCFDLSIYLNFECLSHKTADFENDGLFLI